MSVLNPRNTKHGELTSQRIQSLNYLPLVFPGFIWGKLYKPLESLLFLQSILALDWTIY
jgi:hypothetical protein